MKNTNKNNQVEHQPVMLKEIISALNPQKGLRYVDFTAGYGGHAKAILEYTQTEGEAVLVDRDEYAINVLTKKFPRSLIIRKNFLEAAEELLKSNQKFDLVLADLGVSSPHLDKTSRGFSFKGSDSLDMRMDQTQAITAEEVVNTYSQEKLEEILRVYGQEPKSKRIARLIVDNRPLTSTDQLAEIASKAWPGYSRTHPATRTFQAIRIAVNDELKLLEKALPVWIKLLDDGGRIAIISFHSLEDKIVKSVFKSLSENKYQAELELKNKQPITASQAEIVSNPRARSAKLRVAVKIKTK